jgi:hypothetical protein
VLARSQRVQQNGRLAVANRKIKKWAKAVSMRAEGPGRHAKPARLRAFLRPS